MTCNDKCIHYPVCEMKKYDFANIDECQWYMAEPKQGEWVKGKEISRTMLCDKTLHIDYENFTCSVCGLVLDRLLYNVDGSPFYKFCPNCGADMRTPCQKCEYGYLKECDITCDVRKEGDEK